MKGPVWRWFCEWAVFWLHSPPGERHPIDVHSEVRARDCKDGNALTRVSGRPRRFRRGAPQVKHLYRKREQFDFNQRR